MEHVLKPLFPTTRHVIQAKGTINFHRLPNFVPDMVKKDFSFIQGMRKAESEPGIPLNNLILP